MDQDKHSSCSPFWVTNIFLLVFNGKAARRKQLADGKTERKFQESISEQKNRLEDTKEIIETAFKLRMKEQQREYSNIQSELKLNLDLQKDEVRMFIKGWPLKLSLQAMQELRLSQTDIPSSLSIVIANHNGAAKKGDPLAQIYDGNSGIIDHIQPILGKMGIPGTSILRFKTEEVVTGGAALANIYAMMSNFPTVVIMPRVDKLNQKLIVSIGCWYPNTIMPAQRKVFVLDYNESRMSGNTEYRIAKQAELETSYIAVAAVMNDIYSLMLTGTTPRFPSYAIAKSLHKQYPHIADFMRREYKSLVEGNETKVFIDGEEYDAANLLFDDERKSKIRGEIHNIIESLN